MEFTHIVTLAVLQGFTELLPISSSAHLILVPYLTGWPDQGLVFDVSVHIGTLLAILLYFRREVWAMLVAFLGSIGGRGMNADARLAWLIVIGTLPVIPIGFALKDLVETHLRSPWVVAINAIVFGLLLWAADAWGRRWRNEYSLAWWEALLIGIAQAMALSPGTSRSGITMTVGLALGLNRRAAARFSFLLSMPAIIGAGLMVARDIHHQSVALDWPTLLLGGGLSALSAYLCVHVFLKLLAYISLLPFVLYRLVLGVGLLWVLSHG